MPVPLVKRGWLVHRLPASCSDCPGQLDSGRECSRRKREEGTRGEAPALSIALQPLSSSAAHCALPSCAPRCTPTHLCRLVQPRPPLRQHALPLHIRHVLCSLLVCLLLLFL